MRLRISPHALLLICLLFSFQASALQLLGGKKEDPLLDPSEAFQANVSVDGSDLNVEFNIAPGYFLYKSKFAVESDDADFGPLQIPDGVKKQDEFFGEVETYRGLLKFTAPLLATKNNESKSNPTAIDIRLRSQGCADIGVCYPPQSENFTVDLGELQLAVAADQKTATGILGLDKPAAKFDPIAGSATGSAAGSSPISAGILDSGSSGSLREALSIQGGDEILDPEVAFTVQASAIEDNEVQLTWNIVEGHYLYKKRFSFEQIEPEISAAEKIQASFEPGVWEEDAFFGKSEVYRNSTTVTVPVLSASGSATLKVNYQGCSDIGICYPPITKTLQLQGEPAPTLASVANTSTGITTGTANTVAANNTAVADTNSVSSVNANVSSRPTAPVIAQSEQDRLASSLSSNNRWLTIATFFGMGLLLTFTPCVLPMVPILSSIIVGSGDNISTRRAFTLSLIYVLAMALTYTIAGVIVGLSGENIQATLQHPVVLSALALLFVILSLSMFGFFEIQMPAFVQNRLSSVSNKQKSGSYSGVATMGFLSALIVGPCVTAPLVGALIYIGQTGDAVLGGAALFALSMGMGLPLLVIGTTFGKYLPKAGAWMDITKAIFGVMLLGLAIYMLDRVIPTWATMLLSALLLITVGMFMGAFESSPAEAPGWRRVSKAFGYASVVYGTLLMIGVATGTGTLLKPIQGLALGTQGSSSETNHVSFQRIKSTQQLDAVLADARSSNKPVIVDFYADWCISCKEMEAFTFTDETVATKMNQAVLLQADVTANDELDKGMLDKYGLFGPPAIIFYGRDGNEQRNARVVGFMNAEKFSAVMDQVF